MVRIDRNEISRRIEKNEPVKLSTKFLYEELLVAINSIIARYLSNMDLIFLLNSVVTILREMAVNALKANAKRLFFKSKGLDIRDPNQYKQGIKQFSEEVIGVFKLMKKELELSEFYIKLIFEKKGENLNISIVNNVPILPEELERIKFRIQSAMKYNDFTEAYNEIQDSTEGAGLGIVLTILFLKNMGIDPGLFTIQSYGNNTITTIVIPRELRPSAITTRVKEHILNEIEGIPTFPENILSLQTLCNSPESSIDEIARKIMIDPALTTDVIKLANSAGFITSKRIENLSTAIMTIGLKNLEAILVASNARRILDKRYSKFEQIWEHCNKTAYYARKLAINFKLNKSIENVYMAGLLHDLGKIILLSSDMTTVERIADVVENRKIVTSTIMEEISVGISHSTIGKLISENWNFPEYLISAINNHHSPLNEKGAYRDVIYLVYLANMLCGIEDRKYNFYYIEEPILKRFNIQDEEKFKKLHLMLKNEYNLTKKI